MALRTPLSERIGIEHPFMQSGMGGIGPITLARPRPSASFGVRDSFSINVRDKSLSNTAIGPIRLV